MTWTGATGRRRAPGAGVMLTLLAAAPLLLSAVSGCDSGPPRQAERAPAPPRNVLEVLRGTIGAEASINGIEPVLVSGYGLVVGLNGTGGGDLPDRVAATMEREMGLRGISRPGDLAGTALDGLSPRQILRHPTTAVVLVEAAIPPGAPAGYTFDISVTALNATSLEGGTLWTTDLRVGQAQVFGGRQTVRLAQGRGAVFVNPFAPEGETARPSGRVLNGGASISPLRMEILLDTPSHQRARSMVSAINSRFPEAVGDEGPTASGRSGESIALRVPRRFRERPVDFVELVRHLQIDQSLAEEYARRYVETVRADPLQAEAMSWALEAVGQKALPFIRTLYDDAQTIPQMAGLRAGARLGDPRAAEGLLRVATSGPPAVRTSAISLLSEVDAGPSIDVRLRQLLAAEDLSVRVSAYEALARRAERAQLTRLVMAQRDRRVEEGAPSLTHLETLAQSALPAGTMQGIERRLIAGKFFLDLAPGGEPMIYVAQQGRPRIVLFGADPALQTPLLVNAWGGRLMLSSDEPAGAREVRLFYRDPRGGSTTQPAPTDLAELIELLAREPDPSDPRPGLGMTYSEVVGALYAVQSRGATLAAFATEDDRLRAEVLRAAAGVEGRRRPLREGDEERIVVLQRGGIGGDRPTPGPRVVPIVGGGTEERR